MPTFWVPACFVVPSITCTTDLYDCPQFGVPQWPVLPKLLDCFLLLGVAMASLSSHFFIARSFMVEQASKVASVGYTQVCVFAPHLVHQYCLQCLTAKSGTCTLLPYHDSPLCLGAEMQDPSYHGFTLHVPIDWPFLLSHGKINVKSAF